MDNMFARIFVLILIPFFSSCSYTTTEWDVHPQPPQFSNKEIDVSIVPYNCDQWGCKSMGLQIDNNTDRDFVIDWNKTLYIENGLTRGGFYFNGISVKDRNEIKPPDIVFANSMFLKIIYPSINAYYNENWYLRGMDKGIYGIYLTLIDGENEINEKVIFYFYPEEI